MKRLEVRQKCSAVGCITTLFLVFHLRGDETLRLMVYILHQSKGSGIGCNYA